MVYALCVTVELTSESMIDRFLDAFEGVHAVSNDPSREPGTLSYEVLRTNDDPKTVVILERFCNQSDHKVTHCSSPAFQAFGKWLRGEAQNDAAEGGRVVAKVSSRHFVSSGKAVDIEGNVVPVPEGIKKFSRVQRVVRHAFPMAASDSAAENADVPPQKFKFQNVTNGVLVFGGARKGSKPDYMEASRVVGETIGKAGRPLVYGGGTVGVMGQVAQAALDAGSEVIGVIPEALFPRELSGECIGNVVVTQDMAERKNIMFAASSTVISLPGGVGTLDELFETITLFQLNYLRHKICLLNTCGFYDPLIALLQSQIDEGFVDSAIFDYIYVHNGKPEDVLESIEKFPLAPAAAPLNWNKKEE